MILYKCLLKNNDLIIMAAGNPKYMAIILDLLRNAPPTHKTLLIKIFSILILNLPVGIFTEALNYSFQKMKKSFP